MRATSNPGYCHAHIRTGLAALACPPGKGFVMSSSVSRSVRVSRVSPDVAFLDSPCFVEVARYVPSVGLSVDHTGSCFFAIRGNFLDVIDCDSNIVRLCSALGKRLRLSGMFEMVISTSGYDRYDWLLQGSYIFDSGELVRSALDSADAPNIFAEHIRGGLC